jgi:hypothetical protein
MRIFPYEVHRPERKKEGRMSRKKIEPVDRAFDDYCALTTEERVTFSAMVRAAEKALAPTMPVTRKPKKAAAKVKPPEVAA